MIVLSAFSIYQSPNQSNRIHLGSLGLFIIPMMIVFIVMNLLVVYNLFMGIREIAQEFERSDLAEEATKSWSQFMLLQIASLFALVLIFIPLLGFVYIIVFVILSIIIALSILRFLSKCRYSL